MKKESLPAVIVRNSKAVTTSLEVALRFEKSHDNVLKAIRNITCSDSFAAVNFNGSEYTDLSGRKLPMFYVTRDGFMFLGMGFTGKKAAMFKEDFINAFNRMESFLLNQKNHEWQLSRKSGKEIRNAATDVFQEFVEYAIGQGSTKAGFYYKHLTDTTYKVLGLIRHKEPSFRDTLNIIQLSNLAVAETVAARSLRKHMNANEFYRDIFKLVKNDLEIFAQSLLLDQADFVTKPRQVADEYVGRQRQLAIA